jgi:uncharacterized protein
MERREFLKTAAVAGVTSVAAVAADAQAGKTSDRAPVRRPEAPGMLYRELGTTGERVSAIGLGGYHLDKDGKIPQADAIRLVRSAIDKQLEQSLGRLNTDVIDLVQFHEILRFEDPDRIFADDGAIHAAMAARAAGKIRHIGFTGHKDPQIHLRMFEIAAQHGFKFDTVQMPVNVFDAHFRSFTNLVIPVAVKAGTGVLAMKTFGDGWLLKTNTFQPAEALHYGLSVPGVSVVITGIDKPEILQQALTAARDFKPMTEAQRSDLLGRTRQIALTGKFEPFKTSNIFDGTAQNPKWLGGSSANPEVKPS